MANGKWQRANVKKDSLPPFAFFHFPFAIALGTVGQSFSLTECTNEPPPLRTNRTFSFTARIRQRARRLPQNRQRPRRENDKSSPRRRREPDRHRRQLRRIGRVDRPDDWPSA